MMRPAGTQTRVVQGIAVKGCSPARVRKQAGGQKPRPTLNLAGRSRKLCQRAPWPRGRAAQQWLKIAPRCSAPSPQLGGLVMR